MIYCVSRTYAKTREIQHQKNKSASIITTKPPETNTASVHELYVSNNMMLSLLTLSEQESKAVSKLPSNTQQDDNQFYQYRQSLQKQLSERKVKRNYDLEPITKENNSIQSIQLPEQAHADQNQGQSRRTVPNLLQKSQQCSQNNRNSLMFNTSYEISFGKFKFQKNEIFQDTNSISNVTDTETVINLPMQFQPFKFKQ
ncbi:unnamed protein product (macronuclear) [Paramecium tetraurelia]|uniref:Uncharacterized protein n=1 Tax=Paramecium tetraurelia TaxID=5888 RepID=A0E1Q9_PARTE|nr:uncharacterized protein GSPATT00022397001 [Paramecium tetraurelia]CAK89226.1 unnamed protein product [Paramecium tetraurelia]|eukprot:XP_001456623.1 hypothetical protein (macronuclear) [Paramecium tetraurelia strain d4-2]